jgi:translation initiation factor IF-2
MLPRQLRVGDLVDDYCPRERRLSNHAIVALVGDEVRQVRCSTCDAEHEYRGGKPPVVRKKAPIAAPPLPPGRAVPGEAAGAAPAAPVEPQDRPGAASTGAAAGQQPEPAPAVEDEGAIPANPHAEVSLHRRLIRATLPRVEGEVPARPIPEFTMHRAGAANQRHGKPFRHGPGGSGQPRHGGKGGPGFGRPGGQRQGQGEVDGNSFRYRGGGPNPRGPHGGVGGPGQPHHGRPPRHGFGGKPPRGPRKP